MILVEKTNGQRLEMSVNEALSLLSRLTVCVQQAIRTSYSTFDEAVVVESQRQQFPSTLTFGVHREQEAKPQIVKTTGSAA